MTDASIRPVLTIYRRPGCHLCEDAEVLLRDALAARARSGLTGATVKHVDISGDADLEQRYGRSIPVFAVGDDEIELVTSSRSIRDFLERTLPVLA